MAATMRMAAAAGALLWLCGSAGCAPEVPRQRFGPGDGPRGEGPGPAGDGGRRSDALQDGAGGDRLPPGTCTSDTHCAGTAKPLCQQGKCIACPAGQTSGAKFVNEDIPDGTAFKPGASFTKRWRLRNSGLSTWSHACGFGFAHLSDALLTTQTKAPLSDLERVAPGSTRDFKVPMQAPTTPGTYRGYWRMKQAGVWFGDKVWVEIKVTKCASNADCLHPTKTQCQSDGSCAAPPCTQDTDCKDPLKPYCSAGTCVQCKSAANCPSTKPLCQQGTCVAQGTCGTGSKPVKGQTTWPVPTKKTLCQAFGVPITYQTCGFHTGIDVCGADGDPLLAIAEGKVVHVGPMWYNTATTGRGPYAVILQHSTSFYSTYGHNSKALVKVGDCVTKGQQIALMGNLGYSFGPHLHFEIVDGTPFTGNWQVPFANACSYYADPMLFLQP